MPDDGFGIGASVKRVEDNRFLQGQGQYVDDIALKNQSYAALVRSPHAHVAVAGIETTAARSAPGVIAIYTAEDFANLGGLPCGWQIHNRDGSAMVEPKHPVLAEGKVRHVGDPVALVVAETPEQAREAAGLIDVSYEELPPVVDMQRAIKDGSALVHDDAAKNLCFDWELGERAAVDDAFSQAAHVSKIDLINQRMVANAIEPRAAIGDYNPSTGEHTLTPPAKTLTPFDC